MNTLIVTVGVPRSGKSTWAHETSKQLHCPIVNPDSVRLAVTGKRFVKFAEPTVWMVVRYMVRSLFHAGHNTVILDATNTTKERRKFWLDECRQGYYGEATVCFAVFDTDPETCKQRAIATNMEDLIPVIDAMDAGFEPLDQLNEPHQGVKDPWAGIHGFI
jgi:predicted kinase